MHHHYIEMIEEYIHDGNNNYSKRTVKLEPCYRNKNNGYEKEL